MVVPWNYTPLELFTNALAKWLPRYDPTNNIYVVDAQLNPWVPYNVTLRVFVKNEAAVPITINELSVLRIRLDRKTEVS